MNGFGTMISFELKGGLEAGRLLMDHVRVATLAVSLGGVETLIEHPASMTHASMSSDARQAAGFSDGLVRYSVGIEDVEDLIADLRQALDVVSLELVEMSVANGWPYTSTSVTEIQFAPLLLFSFGQWSHESAPSRPIPLEGESWQISVFRSCLSITLHSNQKAKTVTTRSVIETRALAPRRTNNKKAPTLNVEADRLRVKPLSILNTTRTPHLKPRWSCRIVPKLQRAVRAPGGNGSGRGAEPTIREL